MRIHFSKENNEITNVGTENGNQVYLTATSENLTFEQLSELTIMSGLSGWSVNEVIKNGRGKYTFSRLSFEPIKSRFIAILKIFFYSGLLQVTYYPFLVIELKPF
ncbi:MAG: hypothetical protein N4A45_04890 [Flavobacteriales bacterium]|nr:hypothetical protein [Flavobacteriales bacterium]